MSVDPARDFPIGDDAFLSVRLLPAPGLAERVLLVGRPADGEVRVREWRTTTLDTAGDDYDIATDALWADLEGHLAAGGAMRPEPYAVARWLGR